MVAPNIKDIYNLKGPLQSVYKTLQPLSPLAFDF